MSYLGPNLPAVTLDAGGRMRVGQLTTLGDLKTLNADDPLLLENTVVGGGTAVWGDSGCTLTVASGGDAAIRRSRHRFPYFSGKVTQVEMTQTNFHTQAGCIKRAGYFSSNTASPYASNFDGFAVEDDGTGKFIKIWRNGNPILSVAQVDWNGDDVDSHDWSKFTVLLFDFLWLGGAALRVMIVTPTGFKTLHTYSHSGVGENTFTKSPNHSVRWEARYGTGGGTFRPICAQVSTEGSIDKAGKQRAIHSTVAGLSIAAVGITYPVLGLRRKSTHMDRILKQIGMTAFVSTASDNALVSLHLNPVINTDIAAGVPNGVEGDLVWTDVSNSAAQVGTRDASQVINAPGSILFSMFLSQASSVPPNILDDDFLSSIGGTIGGVSDTLVLCITPLTASPTVYGSIGFKEY